MRMNKWVIFIIIVGIVSAAGVVLNIINNRSSLYESDLAENEEVAQQEPDPIIYFVNTSEYPISPGVLVLHDHNFSMNFLGIQAPETYEALAEVGDPFVVIALLKGNADVDKVFEIAAIEPEATQSITIPRSVLAGKEGRGGVDDIKMSYMAMITETNDGMVWLNGHSFYDAENGGIQKGSIVTEILDMGTEKNTSIGSGFAGGQPDPARGIENIDNGTATSEPVQHHPQFYEDDAVSDEVVRVDLNV